MNKIRYLILFLTALLFSGTVYSAELTAEQKNFRQSIHNFLREEGFTVTIDDEDNSLNFKKEGNLYWIAFGGSSPVYLEFHRSGFKSENADKEKLLEAVNAANKEVRCAKAIVNSKTVSIVIEMYCHSAEEFKYVFYKCMTELDSARKKVDEYYNGSGNSSSSTGSSVAQRQSYIDRFFPISGITLGKTTLSQAKSMGYKCEKSSNGDNYVEADNLTFWDWNNDNIVDYVTIYCNDRVPDSMRNLGINMSMSYNQLLSKFKELGFNTVVTENPTTKEFSGRKCLFAKFKATAPDKSLQVRVEFGYGNDNGEGCTVNSPNSLYDLIFDVDF